MMTTPAGNFTLGVDLAQSSIQATVAWTLEDLDRWRELPTCSIPYGPETTEALKQLRRWLDEVCPEGSCDRVVVESTGPLSQRFARACSACGLPRPAIVNPARIKALAASMGTAHKSDVEDAAAIALYGVVYRPHPTMERSVAEQKARELNRLRESYISQRVACENQLRTVDHDFTRRSLQRMIKHWNREIERLDTEIEKTLVEDPKLAHQVRSLGQIKGIGKVCATTLSAELGLLTQYKRNQIVACAGLFPRQHSSGSSVWKTPKMSKRGGRRVRRVLYMCATCLFKSSGPLRNYIDRMLARGLKKMQIIGALMRKLLIIARAVMVNGGRYEPEKICLQP